VGYILAEQPGNTVGIAAVDPHTLAPAPVLCDEIPAPTSTTATPASALLSPPSSPFPATTTTAATSTRSVNAAIDHAAFVAEQTAFDTASEAFAQKNMAVAVKAFREHAQKFPWSPHARERDRMWIEALIALGRTSEACRRAASFRRAYPKDTLSTQIEAVCPKR
jgi:TolA-binding protein